MVIPRTILFSLAAAALLAAPLSATHAQRATQLVGFRVDGLEQISFEDAPTLVVSTALNGQLAATATTPTGAWSVATNHEGTRITASVDEEMPPGIKLSVKITPPGGGESAGIRIVSRSPTEIVTQLTDMADPDLPPVYQLDVQVTATAEMKVKRTVVLTITAGM